MANPLSSSSCLNGFPAAVAGDRYMSVVDHKGPASYATVVTGTPPTGGDVLQASECGLKYITAVSGQISDDGQFSVEATPTVGGGGEATSVILLWVTVNTGAQVGNATNLSARTIRLIVFGR
jgi:hypothetical protein